MKRLLLFTVCLTLGATTAQAQIIPHYGESVEKDTGKLRGRTWIMPDGFRQESPKPDGATSVIIFHTNSRTAYHLNMEKKTYLSFTLDPNADLSKLVGIEAFETVDRNVRRTHLGQDNIEGLTCDHYSIQATDLLKGGSTQYASYEEWIYEPDKIWRQRTDDIRPGHYLVHRNIVIGPQPAHLLKIPEDFTGSSMPAGGMLELFTGKSEKQIRESDEAKQAQSGLEQLEQALDPNKSQTEQINDVFKLLEGLKKK